MKIEIASLLTKMISPTPKPRQTISLTLASLALCYGYAVKVEGRTPWSAGLLEFFGMWLATYVFMMIFFLAVVMVYISTFDVLTKPNELKFDALRDEITVFFGVVVFVASITITFVI